MKTLQEHNTEVLARQSALKKIRNGIACPKCGEELIDSYPGICLLSDPPKYDVSCSACGYTGYRY